MGFGSFDEDERERREEKKKINDEGELTKPDHNGTVSLEDETDTDTLLDTYEDIDKDDSDE